MKRKLEENKYFQIGFTAFLVIACAIIFYFLIYKIGMFYGYLKTFVGFFTPFIIGFIFAYLLNPIVNFFRDKVFIKLFKKKDEKSYKISNSVSITFTVVLMLGLIILLFSFILPELLKSIETIAVNMPGYITEVKNYLVGKLDDHKEIQKVVLNNYDAINNYLTTMLNTKLLPQVEKWLVVLSDGVFGAVKVIFNIVMGFVISIYYLSDKDNFVAGTKKIIYSIFGVKVANHIMDNARHTNDIFGNFIVGKLLDGFTIGFITFIFLTILGFSDYALLIGVTVGLTNMIPYFGPYIGTIPSALLILMDEVHGGGKMCIIFIIFIIALQQIDSYVIEPKLCGSKTGLKSFWVLASILFFGDAFGIIGLLLGVPVFALIYGYVHNLITIRLEEKNLPSETKDYIDLERINSKTHAVVKLSDK